MGRAHHEQGSQQLKWNTFHDFQSCAQYLINQQCTSSQFLCGSFGSAGGLIGGVLINHFPHLFKAIVMRYVIPSSIFRFISSTGIPSLTYIRLSRILYHRP